MRTCADCAAANLSGATGATYLLQACPATASGSVPALRHPRPLRSGPRLQRAACVSRSVQAAAGDGLNVTLGGLVPHTQHAPGPTVFEHGFRSLESVSGEGDCVL